MAQILAAVKIAAERGLRLPLVYNTGGYDSLEALALLDGVVDIYMPDMKYGDDTAAHKYSHVRDYVASIRLRCVRCIGRSAISRSTQRDSPNAGSSSAISCCPTASPARKRRSSSWPRKFRDTYLNVMGQYRPCYRADEHPGLERPISGGEFSEALAIARRCGLHRLDHGSALSQIWSS